MSFSSKTALITGAGVGIGRATALSLAQKGASLILLDINYDTLQSVKRELSVYTDQVLIYQCDISDEAKVHETVKAAEAHFGKIDILVNNAAIWRDSCPFINASTDLWRKYFDINVMGTIYVTQAVLKGMVERKYGRIINVASVAGVYGNINMSHYSASKAAVIAFTKSLAKEMIHNGILVNAVSPGSVSPADNPDIDHYTATDLSYTGRTGTDRENANLICFLAGDEATYISGQNIQIDGCRMRL